MKTESSTDKKPEVVLDAVYQLQMPNGEFKKKYVKTVRTYGDEHGEDQVEAEIILDRETPKNVGQTRTFAASLLVEPDTYPKFMYQPKTWKTKASQTLDEVRVEAEAVIDAWFSTNNVMASFDAASDSSMVINAIRELLKGYFGGFMLGLILHWIKSKVDARMEFAGSTLRPMPFERKLGTIRRELQERQANLALPQDQHGQFNAQHPYGTPREVKEFGQK